MASVRRKPGTRYWVACYTDGAGVQRQRSTKSINRAEAQGIANTYEGIYRKKQTETQVRRSMAKIFSELQGESFGQLSFGDWFATWLVRRQPEVEPSTLVSYQDAGRVVQRLAPEMWALMLDRVETKHVLDLRTQLATCRAHSTVNRFLKILRQCFKAAWIDGLIPDNPAARVPPARREEKADGEGKRPFTEGELRALLKIADDEWRGMILAGLYTAGQRLSDIATMTASQVDLTTRVVRFETDKTGRDVIVPIVPAWERDLRARVKGRRPGDRLFPRAYARYLAQHGNVGRVSNSFRRLLARVGLAPKANKARVGAVAGRRKQNPLSFHSFRHTATSMLKNAGVSDAVARDIVGHESAAVSANYTHIDEATKRAAMGKLANITR